MKFLNKLDFENIGNNANFAKECARLYAKNNGLDYQIKRYKDLYKIHSEFSGENVLLFSSPGRIEVCGNHTDHNNGKVLCASISVDTIALVTPVLESTITIASVGYPPFVVDINDLEPKTSEYGKSEGLVRGVCAYFKQNGYQIGGFYATTTSDVFKGAGVSSSACFEVLVCEILNVLYNNGKMDALTKAYASHLAESVYFGKPCGLMDQSAIALGGVSYIDFKDTKAPQVESIPWQFEGVDIVLVNCGGDHCGLTDQYASIRTEMEDVAKIFGQKVLRFVNKDKFLSTIPIIQSDVSGRAILRAIHYFDENERVDNCALAIKNVDIAKYYEMINASGDSSYKLLQNCYPEGDRDMRIPMALALSKNICGNEGAIRVHGGGFAGTMIAYVPTALTEKLVKDLKAVFGGDNVFEISIRNSGTRQVEI